MPRGPILPGIHAAPGDDDSAATRTLRDALSRWATGVTVVTARDDADRLYGLTVTAFLPLCLEPPLVAVSLGEQTGILSALADSGRFVVNILAATQKRSANAFADTFAVGGGEISEGDPVLRGAAATLVCTVRETHTLGDHRLVVGQVERAELGVDTEPLLHWGRAYR